MTLFRHLGVQKTMNNVKVLHQLLESYIEVTAGRSTPRVSSRTRLHGGKRKLPDSVSTFVDDKSIIIDEHYI